MVQPKRILVICGKLQQNASDDAAAAARFMDSLKAAGCRVTAEIEALGELSGRLSRSGIYYYLAFGSPVHAGASVGGSRFYRSVCTLKNHLLQSRPDGVVTISHSPYVLAAKLAAYFAGVPVRYSLSISGSSEITDPRVKSDMALATRLDNLAPGASADEVVEALTRATGLAAPGLRNKLAVAPLWARFAQIDRLLYQSVKRWIDLLVSIILLPALLLCVLQLHKLRKMTVQGKNNKPFELFVLGDGQERPLWFWLPSLINVLQGKLSFVGPRILSMDEWQRSGNRDLTYWVAPGLAAWSTVKAPAGAADADLSGMDSLYMASVSPVLDAKIGLLAIIRLIRRLRRSPA